MVRRASLCAVLCMSAANAATLLATYQFNNNLNANQGGVPALTAVDPSAAAGFTTDTVFGSSVTVYGWGGTTTPASQGGFTVNTSTILPSTTSYSAELVFEFNTASTGWRRIADVLNRTSDSGFYVDPGSHLDVFPIGAGINTFTNNAYHHVVLTDSSGTAKAYLDGTLELTLAAAGMDNINNVLTFFLDNTAGGGQGEWAPGRISLLRLYDGVLTDAEVAANFQALSSTTGVPEPATYSLLLAGVTGLLLRRRIK